MLTFEVIIVFLGLIGMVTALLLDKMRPGMILFSQQGNDYCGVAFPDQ